MIRNFAGRFWPKMCQRPFHRAEENFHAPPHRDDQEHGGDDRQSLGPVGDGSDGSWSKPSERMDRTRNQKPTSESLWLKSGLRALTGKKCSKSGRNSPV